MKPRTEEELNLMRKSGEITAKALKKVLESVKEGVNMLELEKIAVDEITKLGGKPSFMTVPGYKWATCLTVNDEVVHGIPRDIVLRKGDILSIDIGALYEGWHTDAAWSLVVGGGKSKFLETGEKALWKAIDQAKDGNRIGDISNAIQSTIEGEGFGVVESLVGHGVGKSLHEDPEIPGIGRAGTGGVLKKGMTIAIEAIYTESSPEVVLSSDKWTIVSADESMGGLFEMSVIIGENSAEVLTDWRDV